MSSKPSFTIELDKPKAQPNDHLEELPELNVNNATVAGNVGKQPSMRQTPSGINYADFSVATTSKSKNGDKTTWHNIQVWGKTAEFVDKYVEKGSQVLVQGTIDNSSYEKDGVKKYFSKIVAYNVQLLGKK